MTNPGHFHEEFLQKKTKNNGKIDFETALGLALSHTHD